ncbi:glycosyltransferase family 2 protein [Paenibacillus aurantiacus]|uniref:Glycosyltransferase family 2 protein n=1 Tax=Paenibacillus aurantiacus TaxID=1936118 RepID=A0ABV5KXS4_9BACL
MPTDGEGETTIATLITHFYNEEYLLPWWLMHHTPLFDHGILVNRGSTDRSVAICQQYAPHWEVRDSKYPEFDAIEVDTEMMAIETEVSGWKMVLNTTEFLCCRNKEQFFTSLNDLGQSMYVIRGINMVDPPYHGYRDPDYSLPLVQQRYHGYFPSDFDGYNYRRFIHHHAHGSYLTGRHSSHHHASAYPYPAFVLKFWFSPWNDAIRRRKLQIGPTFSARAIQQSMGVQHLMSADQLEQTYQYYAHLAQDLRLNPEYRQLFMFGS